MVVSHRLPQSMSLVLPAALAWVHDMTPAGWKPPAGAVVVLVPVLVDELLPRVATTTTATTASAATMAMSGP